MPNKPLIPRAAGAPLAPPSADLKAERVQRELAKLAGWELARGGGAITRTFRFESTVTPILFAALANGLAHEIGKHARLTVLRKAVICQIGSGAAGGLTMKDVGLAKRIGCAE